MALSKSNQWHATFKWEGGKHFIIHMVSIHTINCACTKYYSLTTLRHVGPAYTLDQTKKGLLHLVKHLHIIQDTE